MPEKLAPDPHQTIAEQNVGQLGPAVGGAEHAPEEIYPDGRLPEQPKTERTEFTDGQGEIRRSHPLAAEIVVTDEVERTVSDHFEHVRDALTTVDGQLDGLQAGMSDPEKSKAEMFSVLDDELVGRLRDTVATQAAKVTEERPATQVVEREQRGFLGRKKIVSEQVATTETAVKQGHGLSLDEKDEKRVKELARHSYRDISDAQGRVVKPKDEELASVKRILQEITLDLLLDDTHDPHRSTRQGHPASGRLPLLAHRAAEAGIKAEDLDRETILKLAPELEPIVEAESSIREKVFDDRNGEKLRAIHLDLYGTLPDKELISTIFYSDKDISEIAGRFDRLKKLAGLHREHLGGEDSGYRSGEQVDKEAHARIENFFTGKVLADALVFHGTPFLPRIIQDGSIKSVHRMRKNGDGFTYFTRANATVGGKQEIAEGRLGIHWAGEPGLSYTRDGEKTLQESENDDNWSKYDEEREAGKGERAGGAVAIRLGDAIKHAPVLGTGDASMNHGYRKKRMGHVAPAQSTTVTLTKAGFDKVASQLTDAYDTDDLVFALDHPAKDDDRVLDYEFPLDDLMFEIRSQKEGRVKELLGEAGLTDEQIAQRSIVFGNEDGSFWGMPQDKKEADLKLLAQSLTHARYPRGIVVGLKRIPAVEAA